MTISFELESAADTSMSIPQVALNDEVAMPVLGLGVAKLSDEQTEASVLAALESGCRLIDTAASYGNEAVVGRAIEASGVPRSELFVSTKLGTSSQGYSAAKQACERSLEQLGLDYIDMYLIHWPAPQLGKYVESFEAMIEARDAGLVQSVGVCNFTEEHLTEVIDETGVTPAINQIELHPRLNQAELRDVNANRDIVTQSYSPLGVGRLLDDPAVTALASAHGRTPAQILIRWNLQCGNAVISRSGNPERVAANLDVFEFELSEADMATLDGLHDGTRVLHDPMTFLGT
ncbi:aldo/keto reductase [Mycolicibacter heraklionensis]|uniref:Aldo/keto reductase n=1 Tax=Mycolicibacter heraklionensis TaxID=512402 RepID=A0A9X7WI53_9MYCO|nr:aldo/keto reductase [Mycolicibacter heraklionensis]QZA08022.1 aldo/keto reductase [Mycolicibacter heraklionensis]